jgi:hypothetical protein
MKHFQIFYFLVQSALLRVDQIYKKLGSEKQEGFIPKNEYKALQIIASINYNLAQKS